MNLKINYIDSLIKNGLGNVKTEHLLSIRKLDERYKVLVDSLGTKLTGTSPLEKLENTVRLKLAYLSMRSILLDSLGENADADKVVEKSIIKDIAKQEEYEAKEKAEIIRSRVDHSAYKDLKVQRQTPMETIKSNYFQQLKTLEEELDNMINDQNYDKEAISDLQSLFELISESYTMLSDPLYKLKVDEKDFMGFNPNQEKLFVPGNFADISYVPALKTKVDKNGEEQITVLSFDNFQGDTTQVVKTGELGFGRFRQRSGKVTYRDSDFLDEYLVMKYYADPKLRAERKKLTQQEGALTQWDETGDREMFRISTNINYNLLNSPDVDPEYVKYYVNALLSTYNMEEAIKHNGGYVGNIALTRDGEYTVKHDRDKVCLAREISEARRKNLIQNRPSLVRIDRRRKDEFDFEGGDR